MKDRRRYIMVRRFFLFVFTVQNVVFYSCYKGFEWTVKTSFWIETLHIYPTLTLSCFVCVCALSLYTDSFSLFANICLKFVNPPFPCLFFTLVFHLVSLIPLCWCLCVCVLWYVCVHACLVLFCVSVCVIIGRPPRGNQRWSLDSPDPLMAQHTCPWGAFPPSSECVWLHHLSPQRCGVGVGMLHHPPESLHTQTHSGRGSPEDGA